MNVTEEPKQFKLVLWSDFGTFGAVFDTKEEALAYGENAIEKFGCTHFTIEEQEP